MKRLLFILLFFVSTAGYSQGLKALLLSQGCSIPSIEVYGYTSTSSKSYIAPMMPDPYDEDDILILAAASKNGENYGTPTGWTALGSITDDSLSVNLFWQRASSSGSGFDTVHISTTSASEKTAKIMRFSCVGTSTTPSATMVGTGFGTGAGGTVTSTAGHLAIMLYFIWTEETSATKTAGTNWYGGSGSSTGWSYVTVTALYDFTTSETSETVNYTWGTTNNWYSRMYIILSN